MKKLILLILVFICFDVFSQNSTNSNLQIANYSNDEINFILDKGKLMRAFEKNFSLEENSIENIEIIKVNDEIFNLVLYFSGNSKWSSSFPLSNGNFSIEFGTVLTSCTSVGCGAGCCEVVEVCSECTPNGSSTATCTRKTVGPIVEHYFHHLLSN